MVERARVTYGETNNRFFQDNLLDPKHIMAPYDMALCVRTLMNLRNLEEQKVGVQNLANMLPPGGRLILIEGFRDGFEALTSFRRAIGLGPVIPAAHNFHSYLAELMPTIDGQFVVEQTWHTGLYDFLTRVVFPQLVGAENATKPGDFHSKIEPIVREYDDPAMVRFARVHGFLLARR